MSDCTGLKVGDRVCMNREAIGSVVRLLSKYVEVQPVVGLMLIGHIRKYSRRDGFEWGAGGFGPRHFIQPWDEEKHAPLVEKHELLRARRNISVDVRQRAELLTLEQIDRIKEILIERGV